MQDAGREPPAARDRGRLHRPRVLRPPGQRLRDRPRPGQRRLPAIRGPVRLGVPGRHPGRPPSTRAARSPTSATPRARCRASTAIHSGGAPGFIANEINLTLTSGLAPSAIATASVNFMPRSGSNFSLGDFVDADIAQLEWMPTRSQKTSIFVGKFDSVLGIEYRERKCEPALRHHAVAHRPLHDRHGARPQGALQVRPRRPAGRRRRRHQRLVHHRSSSTSTTRSTPTSARRPAAALSLHPPIPARHGARRLGLVRPAGPRAQRRRARCGSRASTTSCTCARVDLKAQYLQGRRPRRRRSTTSTA